jgi:hypothetical protein
MTRRHYHEGRRQWHRVTERHDGDPQASAAHRTEILEHAARAGRQSRNRLLAARTRQREKAHT